METRSRRMHVLWKDEIKGNGIRNKSDVKYRRKYLRNKSYFLAAKFCCWADPTNLPTLSAP